MKNGSTDGIIFGSGLVINNSNRSEFELAVNESSFFTRIKD